MHRIEGADVEVRCMRLPPGPRGLEALRFLGIGTPASILGYLETTARRYGPISSFRVLGSRVVVVDDAALIAEVLQQRQHLFRRDVGAVLLRELVGDGVLSTDDPFHLERRRLLQPAFHRARISGYGDVMVTEAERVAATWSPSEPVDIGTAMTRLTLVIVGAALFGADVGESVQTVARVLAEIAGRGGRVQPFLAPLAPLLFAYRRLSRRPSRLVFGRERAMLEGVVDPVIAKRRREGGDRGDLLSMLLAAADENGAQLNDEDIRNELITFVLAGHETTSSALAWAWYELARDERVQAALHEEIDRVLGDRAATIDDVQRLPYVAAVFNESLRLYPPAAAFGRRPTAAVELGGYRIPRGASIFVSPYVTQRNPRYFPEPLVFRPERWLENEPPKFAFFPFGGGSKMCIGEPFARTEGVLVLATLARRWRMRLVDTTPVATNAQALLRPSRPVVVSLEARRRREVAAPSTGGTSF